MTCSFNSSFNDNLTKKLNTGGILSLPPSSRKEYGLLVKIITQTCVLVSAASQVLLCLHQIASHHRHLSFRLLIIGQYNFLQEILKIPKSAIARFWVKNPLKLRFSRINFLEYQPSGAWGHSLTACNAAPLAKSKMVTRSHKMADGVWKGVYPCFFGR